MGTAEPSRNVKYSSSTSFQQESYKTESDQKSDLVNDYAHAEEELSEAEADTENSEANIKNSNILHENYGYVKDFIVQKMEEHDIANEKMVGRPLGIGTFVMSKCSIDNKYHTAQILERRHTPGGGKELEYYVHYTQFDRRLDEWVKRERIELDTGSDGHTMDYNKAKNLKMTRQQKRKMGNNQIEDHENMDEVYLREHEEITKVKNIKAIELGRYEMDAWYFSPFPREFESCEKLFFCEFCLTYLKKKEQLQRHMRKCQFKYPPGNEIYRHETLSVFEVDGAKHRVYSENLCQLAKLFLDHKYVYNEVGGFLFYILCECDHRGCHVVAYFSKEKESLELYNLACILTLPPYQKKGYGKFLIAFSYELSKKEGKHGTPERPLSDLGSLSYKHYWTRVLLNIIKNQGKNFTIKALADMTSIKVEDIVETLTSLKLIEYQKGVCTICTDPNVLDSHLASLGNSGLPVHIEKLQWTPYQEQ